MRYLIWQWKIHWFTVYDELIFIFQSNMRLLFCCSSPWELKAVKNSIKSLKLKQSLDISYLCTWLGSYETLFSLTKFFCEQQQNIRDLLLVSIGFCLYYSIDWEKDPNIQIWRIINMLTKKEELPPIPFEFSSIKTIYSSEIIWTELLSEEEYYIDKESWSIEFVCNKFRIPRIFLKIPYDKIWKETTINKDIGSELLANNIDYAKLVKQLLNY